MTDEIAKVYGFDSLAKYPFSERFVIRLADLGFYAIISILGRTIRWETKGLEHLERGAFHPYRRKWVRERKHLPRADVAAAGGWLSAQTLNIYDGADEETLLAVVSEPRKLREAK